MDKVEIRSCVNSLLTQPIRVSTMQRLLISWAIALLSILDVSNVYAAVLVIDTIIMHSIPHINIALFYFTIKNWKMLRISIF